MQYVFSLRPHSLKCVTRPILLVLLYLPMVIPSWGQNANRPRLDINNPRPWLEAVRVAHQLPGLGAAVVTEDGVQLLATTGVRKKGEGSRVTDKDLWHIGSCGKAITATMIARLVEAGKMRYEQTVGETFPELDTKMSDSIKKIRLIDLLSHTSGLPPNYNLQNYIDEKSVTRARRKVLRETIDARLLSEPGEKYSYSNWGYTLAGHMAEKATRKSWEALVRIEVFKPLKMTTTGFGGTGTPGRIDQPWPHTAFGSPMPSNGREMDNLPVMGPAGTMHMSLEDWGKFVSEHLKGHRGKSDYLSEATFKKLHTVVKDEYALGWISVPRPWAGGNAIHHGGDNTMNFALVWAAPEKGFGVLVVTNQSSALRATEEVASSLLISWQDSDQAKRTKQPNAQQAPLQAGRSFPKRAPYSAVRWKNDQPVVKIQGDWLALISIDGVTAEEIVEFSKQTYGQIWKKRFEEDLVEVMAGMGKQPTGSVQLVVQPQRSSKKQTLDNVAMTEANRQAIHEAARR